MLRELYDNFTTRISPFYKEVIVNVKRCPARRYHLAQSFQCRSREHHASYEMGKHGSEGRRPLCTSLPLQTTSCLTDYRAGGTNAGRV
uniref:Uncharacterized protein n=1 Tax=Haemonchus placei TaxID=6290 RepID=A0A0N4WHN1_HAEPC